MAKRRYRQSIYDAWDGLCGYCGEEATSLTTLFPSTGQARQTETIYPELPALQLQQSQPRLEVGIRSRRSTAIIVTLK